MGVENPHTITIFFMSEFKIANTLYYQGKQLRVAKLKLCREVYNGLIGIFAKKLQK